MYEAQLPSDWAYILNDSGAKVVFTANQDIYDLVKSDVVPSVPSLQEVLCLDAAAGEPHAFATAMDGVTPDADGKLIQAPTPEDLANLIYTSGTTGKFKDLKTTILAVRMIAT